MKENDWIFVIIAIALFAFETTIVLIVGDSVVRGVGEFFKGLWKFGYKM